jgi:hypothetical protein
MIQESAFQFIFNVVHFIVFGSINLVKVVISIFSYFGSAAVIFLIAFAFLKLFHLPNWLTFFGAIGLVLIF